MFRNLPIFFSCNGKVGRFLRTSTLIIFFFVITLFLHILLFSFFSLSNSVFCSVNYFLSQFLTKSLHVPVFCPVSTAHPTSSKHCHRSQFPNSYSFCLFHHPHPTPHPIIYWYQLPFSPTDFHPLFCTSKEIIYIYFPSELLFNVLFNVLL